MKDLISVIIPAHNAIETLKETCDSVLANSYKNIELLIIENNSTDDTLLIANKIAYEDNRVKVFSTKKKGVSNARNIGILNAKGEYIAFVDADDKVTEDYFSVLVEALNRLDVDLVQCEAFKFAPKNKFVNEDMSKDRDQIFKWFLSGKLYGYVWGKLFKSSIVKNGELRFDFELEIGEDRCFIFDYLKNCSSVLTLSNKLYHYIQNADSVLNKGFGKNRFDLVTESINEYKYILDNSLSSNIDVAKSNMLRENVRYLIMGSKNNVIDLNQFNKIKELLKKNIVVIIKSKMKLSWKVYALLCCAFDIKTFKVCCKQEFGRPYH